MASVVLLPDVPEPLPAPGPGPGPQPGDAVTLAAIERALGARVGPFADLVVEQGLVPTELQVAALRSTAELGGWENLFALRRGVSAPGTSTPGEPLPEFDVRDRVRMVKTYTPSSGSLELDRDYAQQGQPGERLELHVLHPEWELRPAVLAGLERCFLFDRIPLVPVDSTAAPCDLTAAYPWLTDPSAVWGVEWTSLAPSTEPDGTNGLSVANGNGLYANGNGAVGVLPEAAWAPLQGWDCVERGGGVFLALPGGYGAPWPSAGVRVVVRRPAWTVVNGLDWQPGHVWQDDDVLEVPLPYAAAAALVEAWRLARPRLTPLAQVAAAGQVPMWPTPQEAATELTRMTLRHFRPDTRPPEDRLVGPYRRRLPGGSIGGFADARSGGYGRVVANG